MPNSLDSTCCGVLRALFDLLEADVRPTADLLERLLRLDPEACRAAIARLRKVGLLQRERLNPTLVGLAVATAIPVTDPRPITARLQLASAA